jgi:predicted nucleic acid-binding protein
MKRMPADFLDSNVILYFASRDPAKAGRAEALMRAGGIVSVQVLNEIANVGRKKLKLSWDELDEVMGLVRVLLDVVPLVPETHDRGLAIAQRYGLAIYDSMIVAAALDAGCETLWSEDMQNGLVAEAALTVRNPFPA